MSNLFKNLISECTLFTRLASLLIVIFYAFSFISNASLYLTIIPAYFLPPKFWIFTLFTFTFYESRILLIFINILIVYFFEKLLLPLWGWIELFKYCALANCLSGVFTVFTYYILYVITYRTEYLFNTYIFGMAPMIAALTVASRQQFGDNVLINFKFGKYRNKHVSMSILLGLIILLCVNLLPLPFVLLHFYGLFISWTYLRFYQKHKNGNVGDLSDKFTFAGFFPHILETPISIITNSIFAGLIYLKICKKIDRRYDLSCPTSISISVASGDIKDAERRKQMALRALNERLNQPEKSLESWPNIVEDISNPSKPKSLPFNAATTSAPENKPPPPPYTVSLDNPDEISSTSPNQDKAIDEKTQPTSC